MFNARLVADATKGFQKQLADFAAVLGHFAIPFPDLVFCDVGDFLNALHLLPNECRDRHGAQYAGFKLRYQRSEPASVVVFVDQEIGLG